MKKPLTLLTLIILAIGCKKADTNAVQKDIGFIHAVYFYLDENISDQDRRKFESAMSDLAKVKSISQVFYGPPAMTPREVVDNTYDYAFIVMFPDAAGHDAYQVDPIHKKFIADIEHLIADIKIYDNVMH